jgi:hypothetical protein
VSLNILGLICKLVGIRIRIGCCSEDDNIVFPCRQVLFSLLVIDDVRPSHPVLHIGPGSMHGVVMIPETASRLEVVVAVDLSQKTEVGLNVESSWLML